MNDINFKAMKLRLFILVLVCLGTSTFLKAQQHRLDTVYYDKEWKGVNIPVFASFYRIYDSSDTSIPKRCKTFYISGELYSDAAFISLDKKDDNKTVFDGRTVIYYPNGNIKNIIDYSNGVYDGLYEYYYENGKLGQKSEFVNGKYDGLHCTYDENGVIKEESNCKEGTYDGNSVLYYDSGNVKIRQRYKSGELDGKYTEYAQGGQIIKECHYKDGRLDGLYTQFLDNGNFKQLEYDAGIPKTEYYYLGTPTGQMSRYYLSDNKPYWEPMKEEDRKVTYRNGETWAYYSQNGLTIAMTNSYSNEYSGAVTIPESVTYSGSTYSVTSIGDKAFSGCSYLTSVEIPNSVTSIGDEAFYGCSYLTSVEIPNSVTSIGSSAFYNCSSLTSVEIPNSVTSIGNGAFEYCSSLTSVVIPNSVTSIGNSAFEGCSGLTSV